MKPVRLPGFVCCFLLLLHPVAGWGQTKTTAAGFIEFDGSDFTSPYCAIYRDTVSNPNCIWQVGKPQKPVFNAAYSAPRAIVTDTLNAYPPNDTSSFIIAQTPNFGWWEPNPFPLFEPFAVPYMLGSYQVDADTLTDFGKIEIMLNGVTGWIDILEDTLYDFFPPGSGERPVLTGSSGGWKNFHINFYALCDSLNLSPLWNDTIFLRFSFISDGVQTNRDGLMFDNFLFQDMWIWDNVEEINGIPLSSVVCPNPVKDDLFIFSSGTFPYRSAQLSITDCMGRKVYTKKFSAGEQLKIHTAFLAPGMYQYHLNYDGMYYSAGKFVKE